ncbi:hypothetical protein ACHAQH_005577 [Verticillium albo-atrum]
MQSRRSAVINYFEALAYVLKDADDNGIDVMLTTSPSKDRFNSKSTHKLKVYVDTNFKHGQHNVCHMERALDKVNQYVLNEVLGLRVSKLSGMIPFPRAKQKRPVSIFVMTDGKWTGPSSNQQSPTCGVENSVNFLKRTMKEHGLTRTDVTVQFIRFGNDKEAIKRLDLLDGDAVGIDGKERFDIVDHKASTDPVWSILIGALDVNNDMVPNS